MSQVLKNSGVGDAFNNIGKQLKDGHWVLAFPSVEAANYATLLVDQHAAKLRAYYCEVGFSVGKVYVEMASPVAADGPLLDAGGAHDRGQYSISKHCQ